MDLEEIRLADGTLPTYAWPGGYRIHYLCADGGVLCADCANENAGQHDPRNPQWLIEAYFVSWEGPDEVCDHCGTAYPSEYGDPDEEVD